MTAWFRKPSLAIIACEVSLERRLEGSAADMAVCCCFGFLTVCLSHESEESHSAEGESHCYDPEHL